MHVIIWQFEVHPTKKREFVSAYGPEGDWARLFKQADGYCGTDLMQSADRPDDFITIDRWAGAEDFANFRKRFSDRYSALDARFSNLTVIEKKIGTFELYDPPKAHQ